MSARRKERDANQLAIERAHPGIECDYVYVERNGCSLEYRVTGTADALIAAGMIVPGHLDIIPKCGYSSPGRKRCEKLGIPWSVELRRLPDGRLRVLRWWLHDQNPKAIIARYGLKPLGIDLPEAPRSVLPEQQGLALRRRNVGRFQRPAEWHAVGNLIVVNFGAIRASVSP